MYDTKYLKFIKLKVCVFGLMYNLIFLSWMFVIGCQMGSIHLVFLSARPGCSVAPPAEPVAPECGPAVGSVLSVSGPAAALRLEQTLHPGVRHTHLLPHLLPTPHHRCR